MDNAIQLKHPEGKKAVSMDKEKYALLKKGILNCLSTKGELTHDQLLECITQEFKKSKTVFQGSVGWHMEWVKLDLEARKEIKRKGEKSPIKFSVTS